MKRLGSSFMSHKYSVSYEMLSSCRQLETLYIHELNEGLLRRRAAEAFNFTRVTEN